MKKRRIRIALTAAMTYRKRAKATKATPAPPSILPTVASTVDAEEVIRVLNGSTAAIRKRMEAQKPLLETESLLTARLSGTLDVADLFVTTGPIEDTVLVECNGSSYLIEWSIGLVRLLEAGGVAVVSKEASLPLSIRTAVQDAEEEEEP